MTYSNGYGLNKPSATPDPDGNLADGQVSDDGKYKWNAMMQRWDIRYDAAAHSAYYSGTSTPFHPTLKSSRKRAAALIAGAVVGTAIGALALVAIANGSVKEGPDCTGTSDANCVYESLDYLGIEYNDFGNDRMDAFGDAACTLFEGNTSITRIAKINDDNADMWNAEQSRQVAELLITTYCPEARDN